MFFGRNLTYVAVVLFVLYCCSQIWSIGSLLFVIAAIAAVVGVVVDIVTLWVYCDGPVSVTREMSHRFSCGDTTTVRLEVCSRYRVVSVMAYVYDELPVELQVRDLCLRMTLEPGVKSSATYDITPKTRGVMKFGNANVFVHTPLRLVERRFVSEIGDEVHVYPSFQFIHDAQMVSPVNRDVALGLRQVHRRGHSVEFDTIREYFAGDDYRTINWHATARRHQLMVNQFEDETCQNVVAVVDKGRGMQHSFDGMTLLDYAINATIRLAYTAIEHHDNAGVVTFGKRVDTYVAPSRRTNALNNILSSLYADSVDFVQSDYSLLMQFCQMHLKRRSLIVVFTTFESMEAMRRQLPFLRHIALTHALLVVFFEDSDMEALAEQPHETTREYVTNILAHSAIYEKKMIVGELMRCGISALLTHPENLSSEVINKYVKMKRHNVI